jgi:hypothetical protein
MAEKLKLKTSQKILRIAGVLGVLIGWGAMYFFNDWSSPIFWILISIAIILGYGGAWGGLSLQWGAPPLTNDPLGWRKAKKTYKTDAASDEVTKKDDQA